MIKKEIIHNDPMRFPLLQEPIEERVVNMHTKHMNNMLVDITKKLVQLKKK